MVMRLIFLNFISKLSCGYLAIMFIELPILMLLKKLKQTFYLLSVIKAALDAVDAKENKKILE